MFKILRPKKPNPRKTLENPAKKTFFHPKNHQKKYIPPYLVGGLNPSETYMSQWEG